LDERAHASEDGITGIPERPRRSVIIGRSGTDPGAHPMMIGMHVLAHQGGWDELLFVLVPIALFAGLLALANKRAAREQAARDADEATPDLD
jgi:hypothetical protein